MALIKEIANWKSVRRYSEEPIPEEKITACLEAAHRAPSWENYQPWHFIVIRDEDVKSLLVELSGGQRFIGKAPAIILVAAEMSCFSEAKVRIQLQELLEAVTGKPVDDDFINKAFIDRPLMTPVKLGNEITFARALEQLSYAVSFAILEAVHQGPGACVVGAFGNKATKQTPELYTKLVEILNLPDDVLPLVMITLGIPAENPDPRPRKDITKICHRDKFGGPWF